MKKRETMLDRAIAWREVISYVNGLYAPKNPRSNLNRAIRAAGYTADDIGKTIDVAIGAHRRNGPDGWRMAIVRI